LSQQTPFVVAQFMGRSKQPDKSGNYNL